MRITYPASLTFFLVIIVSAAGTAAWSQPPGVDDSFDDNRYGWWIGESGGGIQKIEGGKLQLSTPDGGWAVALNPYVEPNTDFRLEATIRQTGGVDNYGFGLMWGYSIKENDQNSFTISSTGSFYISSTKLNQDKPEKVKQWITSTAINGMGVANVLVVEQKVGTLRFYINNQEVLSTPAFQWVGNGIGFVNFARMNLEIDDFHFHQSGVRINLPPTLTKGFVKENLGASINTASNDLMPRITADGHTLYFARQNYPDNIGGVDDAEDYYIATLTGNQWSTAVNMGTPINSSGIDNIASVSTDNNTVLFSDGTKFWQRNRSETGWQDPFEMGITFVNEAKHFESFLSADGKALLFTLKNSNNLYYEAAVDERDIYVSTQDENGHWSAPLNLGPVVNTRRDEVSPFLAADGKTLYYSTNGKPGYGGTDIYMTRRTGDSWTQWTEPVNLGPEINSPTFDAYYVLPASGDYAYMVSESNGYGKADIVRIRLAKEIKPDPVVLVHGKTLDAKTKQPISTNIIIDNLTNNQEVGEAISDPKTGDYKIVLPYGINYGFLATAAGHLSVSENLELLKVSTYTEITKDLFLLPIEVGQTIQLNNVFFEQAKAVLKAESFAELDHLVEIMKQNPTMEIELGGYTDNIGKPISLVVLSQDRVGTVKKYMMDKGIAYRRITGKGYGSANPIAKNDTEEHRRMNRRVEFKITKK